ncbi:MAG: hypothetical protein QOK29_3329 [Rhodospirillaceae bacterium]|jgi:phenylacetate-CoA ligase|nr:hypothetical protein [Rhodospirillaceae bacterium]
MAASPTRLSDMRSTVRGVKWPEVWNGPLAALVALVKTIDETQWMPAEEIAARQRGQLSMLVDHAARQSSHFRARLDRAGLRAADLAVDGGLRRLPVLGRRDLQVSGADLYCREVPPSHSPIVETRTSGSTGEPVVVKRTGLNQLFANAMNIRFLLWQGLDFTSRCSAIRAHFSGYAVQNDWGPPLSQLFETGQQQAIPLTTDIKQQAAWLAEFRPTVLTIYPTNLDALSRHCRQHGIELAGLSRILTVGETLSPRVRQEAESTLAIDISDMYSSQELGAIAAACPESGLYHVMAEGLIVEVLDHEGNPCPEGEVGRITITDLHNFATPLIRYDIGDYGEVAGPCPCGRGLPTLKRILGRERNMLLKPDGTQHWPLVGFARFRDIAPISQYQFIQRDLDRIEVRLVSERPVTAAQESELAGIIRGALGHPFRLQFTYFKGEIPRRPGGKFEEFLCEVDHRNVAEAGPSRRLMS